jgi:TPR repeat protein
VREAEVLERRVATLQAALHQCAEVAGRWTVFRRQVTAVLAVVLLALGFTLGIYREPLRESAFGMAQAIGLAHSGTNADAAYDAYQKGNHEAAVRLARPLAEQGDARAQSIVGLAHYRGRGVPRDDIEAANWFRRAGNQGDVAAQYYLGLMFSEGQGVPQDHAEAAKWYRLAADQGDALSQYNLALSYAKGEAGTLDHVSAYVWFNLAAARFPASDPRRSSAVANRDLVAGKMTPAEIAEAQRRSREWKPTGEGQ